MFYIVLSCFVSVVVGVVWRHFWSSWGSFWVTFDRLGGRFGHLGGSWGVIRGALRHLEAVLGRVDGQGCRASDFPPALGSFLDRLGIPRRTQDDPKTAP